VVRKSQLRICLPDYHSTPVSYMYTYARAIGAVKRFTALVQAIKLAIRSVI